MAAVADRASAPFLALALVSFAWMTSALQSSEPEGLAFDVGRAEPDVPTTEVVWIEVLGDANVLLDGEAVALEALPDRLIGRRLSDAATLVVLDVREDASYGAMIAAYDRLASIGPEHGGPILNLTVPSRREIRQYARRYGVDPAEAWGRADHRESGLGRR